MLGFNVNMFFTAISAIAFASAIQTTTSSMHESQVGHAHASLSDGHCMSITLYRVAETATPETALPETTILDSAIASATATIRSTTEQGAESTLVSVSPSPHSNHRCTTLRTSTTRRDPNEMDTTFRTSRISRRAATTPFATMHITTSRHPTTSSPSITSTWDPNGPQPTYEVPSTRPGYFTTNAEGFMIPKAQHTVPYECSDQWKLDHPGKCFGA
ncbi:hypothetical protein B0A54_07178 [Friedmanniomyces endolithicus]|uniref:Uncharacterized protein n=1 Tax=Friedmanniomyces endolithicus TaxID=329885 RepID=A0A4U0V0J6_9PEZI|nr:hypothetical protein B0A54_07178 [Friedmanniomyces endolithicus]